MNKIKRFVRNHKKLCLIISALLLIGVILLIIFGRSNVMTVKRVKKILSPNFYSIDCLDENCEYITASKGDKLGKYTTYVYDANGKKIAKINDKYNSESKYVKTISGVNEHYLIFKKSDYASGKAIGYTLATTKGKEKYSTENVLYGLTNELVSEKVDDNYKIIDLKGKTVFGNVNDIEKYADNNILSLTVKNENIITDSKGKAILNGYRIVSEVTNDNGKSLYFVLEDTNKNGYYCFSYAKNKIVGDSFNGYTTGTNEGELIITKNENGSSKKYVLTKDCKQKELAVESTKDFTDKINNILTDNYTLYTDSVKLNSQKVVFVNNKKKNSFGVYDISSKKYTKLLDYTSDGGMVTIYELSSNEKEAYLQINCSSNYCKDSTMIVYDMVNNKELYRTTDKDNVAQNYTQYEDYKVIKYSLSSNDDYKGKYVLYDNKNKEVMKSDNQIAVIDKELVFGKTPSNQSLILFNAKKNKALNKDSNLASKISIGNTYVYKYSDDSKTYLLNAKGKQLKELGNSSASLIYSKDAIIYIENNRVFIVNPVDNRTNAYKLKNNEKINDNSGENIAPYKNALYINNSVDNYFKVVNVKGRQVKKVKNSSIDKVRYNKKNNTVIIISKRVKDNNNLYGLYIAK